MFRSQKGISPASPCAAAEGKAEQLRRLIKGSYKRALTMWGSAHEWLPPCCGRVVQEKRLARYVEFERLGIPPVREGKVPAWSHPRHSIFIVWLLAWEIWRGLTVGGLQSHQAAT